MALFCGVAAGADSAACVPGTKPRKPADVDDARRAVVAVMRKLAVALYHVGVDNQEFKPRRLFGRIRKRSGVAAGAGVSSRRLNHQAERRTSLKVVTETGARGSAGRRQDRRGSWLLGGHDRGSGLVRRQTGDRPWLSSSATDNKNCEWIYRFWANPGEPEGRRRAAHSGLGTWVGARVASPRCPILRPGCFECTANDHGRRQFTAGPIARETRRKNPMGAASQAEERSPGP